jgi:superoxide dismutase, Fe-Mn family
MMRFFLFLFVCSTLFAAPYTANNYSHLLGMEGFGNSLLTMHFKLYEGYVKNTNDLLAKLKTVEATSYEYGALKRRLGWEFDGMRLHELYFDHLGGNGAVDKQDPLVVALASQYGSFEKWKKDFVATGLIRGIGWAVLYYDPEDGRLINAWINEHDTGHLVTGSAILIMDVFEHAYILQYGLDRAQYINAFFANLNWKVASDRYTAVSSRGNE